MITKARAITFTIISLFLFFFTLDYPQSRVHSAQTNFDNLVPITIDNAHRLVEINHCLSKDLTGQLAWSPDGSLLAVASSSGVLLYQLGQFCDSEPDLLATDDNVRSLSFSLDGGFLAGGDDQGVAHVWKTDTYEEVFKLKVHQKAVQNIFIDDAFFDLLVTDDYESVKLSSFTENKVLVSVSIPNENLTDILLIPYSGQAILSDMDGGIQVMDLIKSEIVTTRKLDTGIFDLEANSKGTVLAAAGIRSITLFNTQTYDKIGELKVDNMPPILAFSPQVDLLASTTPDGVITLWDIKTAKKLITIAGNKEFIDVAFSSQGNVLAGIDIDSSLHLYGIPSD